MEAMTVRVLSVVLVMLLQACLVAAPSFAHAPDELASCCASAPTSTQMEADDCCQGHCTCSAESCQMRVPVRDACLLPLATQRCMAPTTRAGAPAPPPLALVSRRHADGAGPSSAEHGGRLLRPPRTSSAV